MQECHRQSTVHRRKPFYCLILFDCQGRITSSSPPRDCTLSLTELFFSGNCGIGSPRIVSWSTLLSRMVYGDVHGTVRWRWPWIFIESREGLFILWSRVSDPMLKSFYDVKWSGMVWHLGWLKTFLPLVCAMLVMPFPQMLRWNDEGVEAIKHEAKPKLREIHTRVRNCSRLLCLALWKRRPVRKYWMMIEGSRWTWERIFLSILGKADFNLSSYSAFMERPSGFLCVFSAFGWVCFTTNPDSHPYLSMLSTLYV